MGRRSKHISPSTESQVAKPDPARIHFVLLGKFQQGKSTFVRLAVPGADSQAGDGTEPTTDKASGYLSTCGTWMVWDTPGVNAREDHNSSCQEALMIADVVAFVKMTDSILDSAEQSLLVKIAKWGGPFFLLLNSKSPSVDSDRDNPEKARHCKVTSAIQAWVENHLPNPPLEIFNTNLAWAAAGRKTLEIVDWKEAQIRRSYKDSYPEDSDLVHAYSRSQFDAVYQNLFGSGADFFKPGGLFHRILAARIARASNNA
jgi:hypothetical protein